MGRRVYALAQRPVCKPVRAWEGSFWSEPNRGSLEYLKAGRGINKYQRSEVVNSFKFAIRCVCGRCFLHQKISVPFFTQKMFGEFRAGQIHMHNYLCDSLVVTCTWNVYPSSCLDTLLAAPCWFAPFGGLRPPAHPTRALARLGGLQAPCPNRSQCMCEHACNQRCCVFSFGASQPDSMHRISNKFVTICAQLLVIEVARK